MTERKKNLLVNLAVGAALSVLVFALGMARAYGLWRSLSDAFFVAAVMLLGVGGIRAVAGRGAFDVLGYGLKYTVGLVFPSVWGDDGKQDLLQYRDKKAASRKSPKGQLLAGGVYLALAALALAVYEMA